jgi:cephalosporin hydroxylase
MAKWRDRLYRALAWDWRKRFPSAWHLYYRASYVISYYLPRLRRGVLWLSESRETSNFTYDLTQRNENHLAQFLAVALERPAEEIAKYIRELGEDQALKDTVVRKVKLLGRQGGYDPVARFGRRVGWYAIVRAMKPKLVVETGVEKGLGAMVLCAALLRNAQEGFQGRYLGTDIDPGAGGLFCEPYSAMGKICYGDSIESLSALDATIDVFINDSDHSAEYEGREYRVVAPKLTGRAIIVGDNAHVTDELIKFSREVGRQFLFFREEPANHWYLGAGIGLSFRLPVGRDESASS